MKNILSAFAPATILSAACRYLNIRNTPKTIVDDIQTEQSIEAYKKAAAEKRKRKSEKLKRIFRNE